MISRLLLAGSSRIASFERAACLSLVVLIVALIVLNVVTRAANVAIFWVDELAVYAMIWMALIGGSLLLHERKHVAAMLFANILSKHNARRMALTADLLVLAATAGLLVMCIAWFDVVGLARSDFDINAFAADTFNFIYQEPTTTLGLQKYWLWLVVPLVAATMTVHAAANLVTTLQQKEAQ